MPARRLSVILRTADFNTLGREVRLACPSAYPHELTPTLRSAFSGVFRGNLLYRATGVVLLDLVQEKTVSYSLFEDHLQTGRIRELYEAVDHVSARYGKHSLHLASSHPLEVRGKGRRGAPGGRETKCPHGETRRRRLALPLLETRE